ncbi:MAG: chitobiase/beta-hexosaminidase C-terminal domain-containing protein, partial [Lachnospiraceae bacterium]|nr:chitobiase/beta-hexosaminidase C-terminal domain-containing protein [Lachnospiraceae bacterium]
MVVKSKVFPKRKDGQEMKKKKLKWLTSFVAGTAAAFFMGMQTEASATVGQNLILDTEKQYIIWDAYDQSGTALSNNDRVMYDDGGNNEGWLKYDGSRASGGYSRKYSWRLQPVSGQTDQYYLRSNHTGFAVKSEGKSIDSGTNPGNYVVSDKTKTNTGGAYVLEVKKVEGEKVYVAIKSVDTNKYMTTEDGTGNRTYVKFSESSDGSNQNSDWWCIEEDLMPGQEGKQALWRTLWQEFHYRIPAITTNNQGELVAAADKRYGSLYDIGTNWPGLPYGHRIDLVVRKSENNGDDWGATKNLTEKITRDPVSDEVKALGYGDPVLVADRESDDVLLFSVSGSYGYVDGKGSPEASTMKSTDGGESFGNPVKIHQQVYEEIPGLQAFFFSSGRGMQSRYIKVGSHYRIYSAVLGRTGSYQATNANYVFYSDDFGTTWKVLGGRGVAAIPSSSAGNPDEAKIEELPNGDVLITSRTGAGRYVSVFHYDESDADRVTGTWDQRSTISYGAGNSTNGEVYIVYAKNKETGNYGYLALQSLPTLDNSVRKGVSIFYKELGEADVDAAGYASGWDIENNKYMIQEHKSAYSTMTLQADGKIGFMWEERDSEWDILYRGIGIDEITEGKYEIAFSSGIGSKATPYAVTTAEEAEAVLRVYSKEGVYWNFSEEAKARLMELLTEEKQKAQELLEQGVLGENREETVALQQALEQADSLNDASEEKAVIAACGTLIEAIDIYEELIQMESSLIEQVEEAEALLAENLLDNARLEAAQLREAIAEAKNRNDSVTHEEITALIQTLEEKMEVYTKADVQNLYVEARYSSNRIQISAMEGVTAYKVKRSTTENGTYEEVASIPVVENQLSYDYIDTTAGKGTQYWYDVEMIGGENLPELAPIQDKYETGVAAVQLHAAENQLHYDFVSGALQGGNAENPTYFDGSRIFEGSQEDLEKVKDLEKGSVLISYKPDNATGRKGMLILKREGVTIPSSGNLNEGIGFVFLQENNQFRWDSSKGNLRGQWTGTAPASSWSTFGFSSSLFVQGENNIINSWNGTTQTGWGSENWNGFLTRPTNLGVITVGGDKTDSTSALTYAGHIAYVTITDEPLSQTEINEYTKELTDMLIAAETQAPVTPENFVAEAKGEGEVYLSWTPVEGIVSKYELSKDNGTTWVSVNLAADYTWTELESDTEYTFLLRAVNQNGNSETASVTVRTATKPQITVEAPAFSPAPGTYTAVQQVTIASETEGAEIYYTIGEEAPTAESTRYSGPIEVAENMVVRAVAIKDGVSSQVVMAEYIIQLPAEPEPSVANPVFTPAAGTYTEAQTVTITTKTEGAVIYYTEDGSEPTTSSKVYNKAITVDKNVTIKAMAVKEGMKNSQVATAEYIINIPNQPDEVENVEAPVFSPKGGTYTAVQTVTIKTATQGAVIYYTEDGSVPTTSSKVYSKAITVDKNMTLKAMAVKEGMKNSQVATAEYIINIPSRPGEPSTPSQPAKPSKPWIFIDVEEKNDWKHTSVKFVYEND